MITIKVLGIQIIAKSPLNIRILPTREWLVQATLEYLQAEEEELKRLQEDLLDEPVIYNCMNDDIAATAQEVGKLEKILNLLKASGCADNW